MGWVLVGGGTRRETSEFPQVGELRRGGSTDQRFILVGVGEEELGKDECFENEAELC